MATLTEGEITEAILLGDTERVQMWLETEQPRIAGHLIHAAVFMNRAEVLALLLEHGGAVNAPDADGRTPLHEAAFTGSMECAELLLEKGADVHAVSYRGERPLAEAVEEGWQPMVRLLLAHGADAEDLAKDDEGRLRAAVQMDLPEVPEKMGAEAKLGNLDELLRLSIEHGSIGCVRVLLSFGASPDAGEPTPLMLAVQKESPEIVELLWPKERRDAETATQLLEEAVASKSLPLVQFFVRCGGNVNTVSAQGMPLLHQAVLTENLPIIEYLLAHGADVCQYDFEGYQPLHRAVEREPSMDARKVAARLIPLTPSRKKVGDFSVAIVDLLLQYGAELNATTQACEIHKSKVHPFGCTVLHLALSTKRPQHDLVLRLMEAGANINMANSHGWTPLSLAVSHAEIALVETIAHHGGLLFAPLQGTETMKESFKSTKCLYWTIEWMYRSFHPEKREAVYRTLAFILPRMENDFRKDITLAWAMSAAVSFGDIGFATLLIEHGCCLNNESFLYLVTAARAGHIPMVKFLLENGALPDGSADTPDEERPLVAAVSNGGSEMVKLLLSHGARITTGSYGALLLSIALEQQSAEIVRMLIEAGASPDEPDAEGKTALARAREYQVNSELLRILESKRTPQRWATVEAEKNDSEDVLNAAVRVPLHLAASDGDEDWLRRCLKEGYDINTTDVTGLTPLQLAVRDGHAGTAKLLLEAGADPNAGKGGIGAFLSLAVQKGDTEIVALLMSVCKLSASVLNQQLWEAVRCGSLAVTQFFLEQGVEVNPVDEEAVLAQYKAAAGSESSPLIALLMQYGVDINIIKHGESRQ